MFLDVFLLKSIIRFSKQKVCYAMPEIRFQHSEEHLQCESGANDEHLNTALREPDRERSSGH
jgi:hypothetical protein